MAGLIFGVVAIAFFGSQIYLGLRRRRRLGTAWGEAARRAGLTDISVDTSVGSARITARAGTRLVRLESSQRSWSDRRECTLIRVGSDSRISLRAENVSTAFEKAVVGMGELQIGDESFDRAVYVEGRPEVLRAILDAETRSTLQGLIRGLRPGKVSVLNGDVCAELDDDVVEEQPALLASFLKDLLDVAQRMDQPTDVVVRIADNTRREPEWRVRLENLQFLIERFPDHVATRETLRQARSDEHPEVRLRAALASGKDGIPTLLEMASLRSAEDSYAARAVRALGDRLAPESAEEILVRALRSRQLATAGECLESLGRTGGSTVVTPIATVLQVEDGELAAQAARALGATGASEAEAPLQEALLRDSVELRAAAAAALARVGTAAAVLSLKEAAENGSTGRLRSAARQAIAEIQSRLQGASPGQVSLAEGETGQLSLAGEDPAGRVSLPGGDADG